MRRARPSRKAAWPSSSPTRPGKRRCRPLGAYHLTAHPGDVRDHIGDDGRGFDWRTLPAVEPENILAFNGRGIFLTKIYFDEVVYNDSGNVVTLRKHKAGSLPWRDVALPANCAPSRGPSAGRRAVRGGRFRPRSDEVVGFQVSGDLYRAFEEPRPLLLDHDLQEGVPLLRVHLPAQDCQGIVRGNPGLVSDGPLRDPPYDVVALPEE